MSLITWPRTDLTRFVDDRPEDLSADLDVITVSPYLAADPHDRGLAIVATLAGLASFGSLLATSRPLE